MPRKKVDCRQCVFYKEWRYSRPDCLAIDMRDYESRKRRPVYRDPRAVNKNGRCKEHKDKSCHTRPIAKRVWDLD